MAHGSAVAARRPRGVTVNSPRICEVSRVLHGSVVFVLVALCLLSQALVELGSAVQRHRHLPVVREVGTLTVCGMLSLTMLGVFALALSDPPERQHLAWVVLAAFLMRDATRAAYRRSLRSTADIDTRSSLDPRDGS